MPDAKVPRPFAMPWGSGVIAEEARVEGEHHVPAVQLMDYTAGDAAGSWGVRFCWFNQRGAFQRSPLMLTEESIAQMREALKKTPRLREILRQMVG